MNTLALFGVILVGVGVAAVITWGLLRTVLDLMVLRRIETGDVGGVKKVLQGSANRISQRVRVTAEVWLKDREGT